MCGWYLGMVGVEVGFGLLGFGLGGEVGGWMEIAVNVWTVNGRIRKSFFL